MLCYKGNLECKILIVITIRTSTLYKIGKCASSYRYSDKNTALESQYSYHHNNKNICTLKNYTVWTFLSF